MSVNLYFFSKVLVAITFFCCPSHGIQKTRWSCSWNSVHKTLPGRARGGRMVSLIVKLKPYHKIIYTAERTRYYESVLLKLETNY